MTINKRTVSQFVFDSPEAIRIAKSAVNQSIDDLAKVPRHMLDKGNPNHPDYDLKIFGYDADIFMKKQY